MRPWLAADYDKPECNVDATSEASVHENFNSLINSGTDIKCISQIHDDFIYLFIL